MKTVLLQSLRASLGALLLLGLWIGFSDHARLLALPDRLQVGVLVLVTMAVTFATLFRRVRSEDRIARLEAALCREQKARSQADQALAESDMLLGRLTVGAEGRRGSLDPLAQLVAIQSELLQVRRQYALEDPLLASRIDLLCTRVDRVAQAIVAPHAAEPG
ncbi:hypothetical protein [Massilia putida]|uniref:hypothetical protein n=1 Tax=Massilia putida TaxID=1141883 RepID=UPI0009522F5E|nr:hypothetical protein [Massilia putida]